MNILIFGDNTGIPQLLRHIPTVNLVGIVCASIRPEYHNELLETAKSQGLPLLIQPLVTSPDYEMFGQMIGRLMPDLIFVNSYSMIIREDILAIPRFGGINIHGALLPKYRGCNPTQWSILNSETSTGVTIHEMTGGIDEGAIIAQQEVPIYFKDTWKSVNERIGTATDLLIIENINFIISGNWESNQQDDTDATYFDRRTPEDGIFSWSEPIIEIYNKVRALLPPLPAAFYVDTTGLKVHIQKHCTPWEITSLKYESLGHNPFASNRLRTRTLDPRDSGVLFDWVNSREFIISKSTSCLACDFDPETIIETVLRKRFNLIVFVIEEIASGKAIGTCQLFDIDCVQKTAAMQIKINDKLYIDKGFEGEAAHIFANFGFHQLQLQHIYLKVFGSDAHAQQKRSQTTSSELWDIEQLINEGQTEDAIKKLNSIKVDEDNYTKKEFLLGYVNKVNNNESVAIRHFFKANTTPFTHLPAAEEATNILCKNGYVKEAAYFIKQTITKLDDENTLVQSDLDSIYSCFESYKNQKIISIHQPAYIAWLGYFHKIYYADKFVIHDAVQFSKKSFIKRTLIKKTNANESRYLTIPAQKHSDYCYINEMKANETNDWRNKHIREIESTYRTAPYFKSVFPLITSIFESTRTTSSIVDITSKFTLGILEILEIKREIYYSSQLLTQKKHKSPHYKNMELCEMLGGSVYFSGGGARNYQDGMPLPKGINLIYQNFWKYIEENPYVDKSNFINGLSILDALFYIGPLQINELFSNYENPSHNLIFS